MVKIEADYFQPRQIFYFLLFETGDMTGIHVQLKKRNIEHYVHYR
jgi:hypothetical protein